MRQKYDSCWMSCPPINCRSLRACALSALRALAARSPMPPASLPPLPLAPGRYAHRLSAAAAEAPPVRGEQRRKELHRCQALGLRLRGRTRSGGNPLTPRAVHHARAASTSSNAARSRIFHNACVRACTRPGTQLRPRRAAPHLPARLLLLLQLSQKRVDAAIERQRVTGGKQPAHAAACEAPHLRRGGGGRGSTGDENSRAGLALRSAGRLAAAGRSRLLAQGGGSR